MVVGILFLTKKKKLNVDGKKNSLCLQCFIKNLITKNVILFLTNEII